jgi:hypothetical protein
MTTLAGSGVSGIADGPADSAQFVAPAGVAVGPDGVVYVADRGAQRIRVNERNGSVETLAGSGTLLDPAIGVAGGYADGPASSKL